MNVLQEIFNDYYNENKYILYLRKCEFENIEKMIHCGDPSFGDTMFDCSLCGNLKFVPFRCIVVYGLLVAINMPLKELPRCLLNSLMSSADTLFLL